MTKPSETFVFVTAWVMAASSLSLIIFVIIPYQMNTDDGSWQCIEWNESEILYIDGILGVGSGTIKTVHDGVFFDVVEAEIIQYTRKPLTVNLDVCIKEGKDNGVQCVVKKEKKCVRESWVRSVA